MPLEEIEIHERLSAVETSLVEIKSNHLAHIWATIQKLDERLWVILSSIILGFLVTIITLIWK